MLRGESPRWLPRIQRGECTTVPRWGPSSHLTLCQPDVNPPSAARHSRHCNLGAGLADTDRKTGLLRRGKERKQIPAASCSCIAADSTTRKPSSDSTVLRGRLSWYFKFSVSAWARRSYTTGPARAQGVRPARGKARGKASSDGRRLIDRLARTRAIGDHLVASTDLLRYL